MTRLTRRLGKKSGRRQRPSGRRLLLENLEQRLLLVSDWTNQFNARDVNDDGEVSPIDALIGINELNAPSILGSAGRLPDRGQHVDLPAYDVSGDGFLVPIDVLIIINALNQGFVQPTIDVGLQNDTGRADDDGVSADPAVTGTIDDVEGVARVTARIDGGEVTELDFAGGDLLFDPALANDGSGDGEYVVRITVFDADVIVNAAEVTLTYDTQAPAAPTFDLTADTDTAPQSDQSTQRELVALEGQSEPQAIIELPNSGHATAVGLDGNFKIFGLPLTLGQNLLEMVVSDIAGNDVLVNKVFTRTPTDNAIVLTENDSLVTEVLTPVALGHAGGTRKLSFNLSADFDSSDAAASVEDVFSVYLVDENSTQTILDRGAPGTALFSLSGEEAEFVPGMVRFDGSKVEIDTSSLPDRTEGRLLFQLINLDGDTQTQVAISDVTSILEPEGIASPAFPLATKLISSGGTLDTASLTLTDDVELDLTNRRLNSSTGRYTAELRLRNQGAAKGRTAAVVFQGLPNGVTVVNASDTDSNGNPYLNLTPTIRPGGLTAEATSQAVLLEIDNASRTQFPLVANVLVGPPNSAPVLDPIDTLSVMPGGFLEVPLTATDADGDPVTFSIRSETGLPNVTLDGNGRLIVEPLTGQEGSYQFDVVARDGAAEATQSVTLDVVEDPVTTTRISGVILNTELEPLAGIPIELDGASTTTAADGSFLIDVGNGPFPGDTLIVRGEQFGGPEVYPFIAEKLDLLFGFDPPEGVNNVLDRPIFLPALDVAGGTNIDPNNDTTVTQEIRPGMSASVFVAAGSLMDQQGNPYDDVLSITEVPADRTPAVLPDGIVPEVVVTIQPGEMVFTQPAPLTLPNTIYAPGTILDLFSINPVTGAFDIVGQAQVSADGTRAETITGGVRNSSWHYVERASDAVGDPDDPNNNNYNEQNGCSCGCPNCNAQKSVPGGSDIELHSGALIETHDLVAYQSRGVARGVTLTYDSVRADPRPIVHFNFNNTDKDRVPAAVRDSLRIAATLVISPISASDLAEMRRRGFNTVPSSYFASGLDPRVFAIAGGALEGAHVWRLPDRIGRVDAAIQGNGMEDFPTGLYFATTSAGGFIIQDGPNNTRVAAGFGPGGGTIPLLHVNESRSPFGAGWGISVLQRLIPEFRHRFQSQFELPEIMLVDGDGSELLFSVDRFENKYISPAGDFSTLERLQEGSFRRTTKDKMVYDYDVDGRLTSVRDRIGNRTSYEYSGDFLSKIIDPVGLETEFRYSNGLLDHIEDPTGRQTTFEYDGNQNLSRIADPDGTFRTFQYDDGHRMTGEIDKRGNQESVVYDFAGRVTETIRRDGSRLKFQPAQTQGLVPPEATVGDPENAPAMFVLDEVPKATVTDGNGNVMVYNLDHQGLILSVEDGVGKPLQVERNRDNQVSKALDGRANETNFTYDGRGNVTSISDTLSAGLEDTEIIVGAEPSDIVLADIDGNLSADIVTVNAGDRTLSLVSGNGDGTFAGRTDLSLGDPRHQNGPFAESVVLEPTFPGGGFPRGMLAIDAADFNNDGLMDFAAFKESGDIVIQLSNGDGTFDRQANVSVALDNDIFRHVKGLVLADDFDGDGVADLVHPFTRSGATEVHFRKGNGDGTFQAPIIRDTGPPQIVGSIQAADLNGDNILDLVGTNFGTQTGDFAHVFLGRGDGTFEDGEAYTGFANVKEPVALALADLDNQNGVDIVVGFNGGSSRTRVAYLLNSGDGTFQSPVPLPEVGTTMLPYVKAGDFDENGTKDILVLDTGNSRYSLFSGDGTGGFSVPTDFHALPGGAFHPYTANEPIDVNSDGHLDAVFVTYTQNVVGVLLGRGDGTFETNAYVASPGPGFDSTLASGARVWGAVPADFTGDGVIDLVVTKGHVNLGRVGGVSLLPGTVPGKFRSPHVLPVLSSESARATMFGDIDNDGDQDYVALNSGSIDVLPNDGIGNFGDRITTATQIGVGPEVVGRGHLTDFDQDGNLDVLRSVQIRESQFNFQSGPRIGFGVGDGTFTDDVRMRLTFDTMLDIATNDLNGDTFPDIVSLKRLNGIHLETFLYDPTNPRTFVGGDTFELPNGPNWGAVAAEDFTGDGLVDLMATFNTGNGFGQFVLFQRTDQGSYSDPILVASLPASNDSRAMQMRTGDVNLDGDLDAVVSITGMGVFLLENDGTGNSFQTQQLPCCATLRGFEMADLEGDGDLDLMVAHENQGVFLSLNDGTGAFGPLIRYASTSDEQRDVTAADVNDDGLMDVAFSQRSSSTGGFGTTLFFGRPDDFAIDAANIDADGGSEVALVNGFAPRVTIFNGDAGQELTERSVVVVGASPTDVVLTDLDGDGNNDVVTANASGDSVSVAYGNGDGTFAASTEFPAGNRPTVLATGNLTPFTVQDIVVANPLEQTVTVLLDDGAGGYNEFGSFDVLAEPVAIAIGDLDNDTRLDIATANQDGTISVLYGNGAGGFDPAEQHPLSDEPLTDIVLTDREGDGDLDILASGSLHLLVNVGGKRFGLTRARDTGEESAALDAALLDDDNAADFVIANRGDGTVSVRRSGVQQSASARGERTFTYDFFTSQVTSITDELGRQTLFNLERNTGNVNTMTEVVGQLDSESGETDDVITQFTYVRGGQFETITDPLGRVTAFEYDALGRLTTLTTAQGTPDEGVVTFTYDAVGNVLTQSDENGNLWQFTYDTLNRLTSLTDPLDAVQTMTYDANGNLIRAIDRAGSATRFGHDPMDRITIVTDELFQQSRTQYDPAGNVVRTIDPLGHASTLTYDQRNRIVTQTDPDDGLTQFGYDQDDNLNQLIDPVGNETRFLYDARNQQIAEIDPLGKNIRYSYDATSNLVRKSDRNGRITQFVYDDLDRLTTETWIDNDASTANTIGYAYDKASNLLSVVDNFSSLAFTYDNRDRAVTVDNAGTPAAPNVVLTYEYDALGNVTAVTDDIEAGGGARTTYLYDPLNRVEQIQQTASGSATVADKRVDFTYNAIGQFAAITRFSDLAGSQMVVDTGYTYDDLNRLIRIAHDNTSETVAFYDYAYDTASRISQISDIDGVTDYSYDDRDQLIGADHSDANNPDETYTYDANGNRTDSHLHGAGYDTGEANRLLSDGTFNYEYDLEGNRTLQTELATGETREFEYDHRNRLTAVIDRAVGGIEQQRVEFTYDAFGRRISKHVTDAVDDVITHFAYDREDVLLDFVDSDGAGGNDPAFDKRYLHGPAIDQVLAQEDATGDVQWHLTDHLGTVRDLTDNNGNVANHITYDSYGNILDQSDPSVLSRYAFTGRESDEEIALYFYRARYYDSITGQFLGEDAVGIGGGYAKLHVYVGNSPVDSIDPDGLHPLGSPDGPKAPKPKNTPSGPSRPRPGTGDINTGPIHRPGDDKPRFGKARVRRAPPFPIKLMGGIRRLVEDVKGNKSLSRNSKPASKPSAVKPTMGGTANKFLGGTACPVSSKATMGVVFAVGIPAIAHAANGDWESGRRQMLIDGYMGTYGDFVDQQYFEELADLIVQRERELGWDL